MNAAIVSIGDELISGVTVDSNSAWIAQRIREAGVRMIEIVTVGDDRNAIAGAFERLARQSDLLIVTGGLGPTPDDLTRFALLDVIAPHEELVEDPDSLARLRARFRRLGRTMPDANRIQAMRPPEARLLENAHGTAPGIDARHGSCRIICLPGVPREMREMFQQYVLPITTAQAPGRVSVIKALHLFGLGESTVAERLGKLLDRDRTPRVGTTAAHGLVSVRIYTQGPPKEIGRQAKASATALREKLDPFVFGEDDDTLASAVGELLHENKATLATAESCTGGMIASHLTDIAGSSAYFGGGIVSYSNDMKVSALRVESTAIAEHGAVSSEVAARMARGALRATGATLAVAVTGIAGPSGGSPRKPVGTVYIALAGADNNQMDVRRFRFPGDRATVRRVTVYAALQMVRFHLLGVDRTTPLLFQLPEGSDDA